MPEIIPEMVPVESSNLNAVGYVPSVKALHVRFKSGQTYVHVDVPAEEHRALMAARSKGGYYNAYIKGVYTQYRRETQG